MSSFEILNFLVIFGLIIAALCVFFLDDILQCIIAMAVLGTFLALEFLLLKAPDVAIAEAAVGAILTPVLEGTLYKIIGKSTASAIALK